MKILVYTSLNKEQQTLLKNGFNEDYEILFKTELSENELQVALAKATIVIGNIPTKHLELPHPSLQFWQLDSAGFDQYKNIKVNFPVANMGDFYAQRCAETIVAGVLSFYRGIPNLVRLQVEKKWVGSKIRQQISALNDKKVLILGAGAIALATQKMLNGFGCELTLVARKNPLAKIHSFEEVLEILPEIDLVINTLPGAAVNYVSAIFINAMKKGSVYANIGRGNTTDERALIKALEDGKLAGVILDVTEVEPLPIENKLWEMEQVLLTQHSGGGDINEMIGKIHRFIKNVNRFINHHQPEDLIDLEKGY